MKPPRLSPAEVKNAQLERAIRDSAERTRKAFDEAVADAMLALKDEHVIRCAQQGRSFYVEFRRAAQITDVDDTPGELLCIVEIEWSDEANGRICTSWAAGYPKAAKPKLVLVQ